MTKDQELAILAKAASDLGSASYLGDWLASITWELERDLRSDFIPVLTLSEARRRADEVIAEAHYKAEKVLAGAQREADKLLQDAIDSSRRVRAALRHDLQQALNNLN